VKPWQIEQLESLYRKAVQIYVNAASMNAPCEVGCGRLGQDAHHIVFRSQEPGLRWKYEPMFGLWVCPTCHAQAHTRDYDFVERALQRLKVVRPAKAKCLSLYIERHDKLKCPDVTFDWMGEYLRRRIAVLQRNWMDSYCCDV
jgi:hypothetical protein